MRQESAHTASKSCPAVDAKRYNHANADRLDFTADETWTQNSRYRATVTTALIL